MTTHLERLLSTVGYQARPAQQRLYEALIETDHRGTVAQAGTGVGKSIAVLAAAAHARETRDTQSLIVTPTRVLMDQYMASDAPAAGKAFGMDFAELRGKAHYVCDQTNSRAEIMGDAYDLGCQGEDVGCTRRAWIEEEYTCGYQSAKEAAMNADVVVTNTDFWLINDRLLTDNPIFDPSGALFVDEAHQLDAKMREYASRSMSAWRLRNFKPNRSAGKELASWIEKQGGNRPLQETQNFPVGALMAIAGSHIPDGPAGGRHDRDTLSAARSIVARMREPMDACVIHVGDEAIKMDWTSVAASAGEVLQRRPFALVSATVPLSMPRVLGVPNARYLNLGHPFDYSTQATLKISSVAGDFKSRGPENFRQRIGEVIDAVTVSNGGALILVNSRNDCEFLGDYLAKKLRPLGLEVRRQGDPRWKNDELTEWFKASENNVLVATESFRTGFDAPGRALRLVVIWSLPYPGQDPVTKKIAATDFNRYSDMMKVAAIQGIGRLIRTTEDRGHVLITDSRATRLLDQRDPLTQHLLEFRRV